MSLNNYLKEIELEVGRDKYDSWERQAMGTYEAMNKQAMHRRPRGVNHDPHLPRAQAVGGLIVALYELSRDGIEDISFDIRPTKHSPGTGTGKGLVII